MSLTTSLSQAPALRFSGIVPTKSSVAWQGPANSIAFDEEGIRSCLLNFGSPCYVVRTEGRTGITSTCCLEYASATTTSPIETLTAVPPLMPEQLGDPEFLTTYNVKYAFTAGAMANGIASEDLVIALGKVGLLSSFGAGGLVPSRVEAAIQRIQQELPNGPYAFNLLHSPYEPAIERDTVALYLKYGIPIVEASAYLDLSPQIVRYRVAGLQREDAGNITIHNHVIAKVSRREVAAKFMQPAPANILNTLLEQGEISQEQALLAERVPMADDITVEADSGGHTDNRPLVCLLPAILALRDEMQARYGYAQPVRVGAAGGIGTPQAVLGAFMMGAAYVVAGSVMQACLEAGTSTHVKQLLAQADMADVLMAPAADMFEMGVKLQVLKRGTFFPMRAQKLFNVYTQYASIDAIPPNTRKELETQLFRKSLEAIWDNSVAYFTQRDPEQVNRAEANPKRKMALIFRWYLGQASRWANTGEIGREMDYQIWCGPAMGAFNNWTQGSFLEQPEQRHAVDVSEQFMKGATYLYRLHNLKLQGLSFPSTYWNYRPE